MVSLLLPLFTVFSLIGLLLILMTISFSKPISNANFSMNTFQIPQISVIFLLSKVLYIGFICHTLYLSYVSLCLGFPADMICEGRMYVQETEDTWPTKCNHIDRAWLIFIAIVTPISPASSLYMKIKMWLCCKFLTWTLEIWAKSTEQHNILMFFPNICFTILQAFPDFLCKDNSPRF